MGGARDPKHATAEHSVCNAYIQMKTRRALYRFKRNHGSFAFPKQRHCSATDAKGSVSAHLHRRQRPLKRRGEAFLVIGIEKCADVGVAAFAGDLHLGNADFVVAIDFEPRPERVEPMFLGASRRRHLSSPSRSVRETRTNSRSRPGPVAQPERAEQKRQIEPEKPEHRPCAGGRAKNGHMGNSERGGDRSSAATKAVASQVSGAG
jgi:hypothetical protein